MEAFFNTIFKDVRHERSLILLLSIVEPNILKQSKFTDDAIENIKNLALEKLHRQRILKACRNGSVRKTIFRSINLIIIVEILIFLLVNE